MYKHTRILSVVSYITWLGWLVAFILRDHNDPVTHQHINQALNLNIIGVLVSTGYRIGGIISNISGVIAILALLLTIMGIVRALQMSDKPLPIVGKFSIF